MKVCLLNRNPTTHAGGDLIMLARLGAALQKLGVECTNLYGDWRAADLLDYDITVIYHCNLTWSRDNWQKARKSGVPFVVLPIFYPTDQLGMRYEDMYQMFSDAQAVVPLSFKEAREITTLTGFSGPFHIIPHGTEERFHWPQNKQGLTDRAFVMCANARGQKGEERVEKACRRLGLPFKYVQQVPHEELHLVYWQAKVFVHSSPDDRMSLTVGEALCSGCRVISSIYDRGNEWFPGLKACNPQSDEELYEWIGMAWRSEQWDWRPNERAREMTWERAAKQWLRVLTRAVREGR